MHSSETLGAGTRKVVLSKHPGNISPGCTTTGARFSTVIHRESLWTEPSSSLTYSSAMCIPLSGQLTSVVGSFDQPLSSVSTTHLYSSVSRSDGVSFEAEPFAQYSETMRQGGIRWRLKTPDFVFGHKLYPKLHSQAVAAALRSTNPDPTLLETLKLPYTPLFENIELSYCAEKTFSLAAADADLEMMLLRPFGYSKRDPGTFVADYSAEGSLYIGLSELVPPQNLSILIQLAESGIPQNVSQVSNCCPTNLSVVSRHLKVLREAGVLSSEKQGKEVYYSVRTDNLVQSLRALADAIETCCPDGTCRIQGTLPHD